MNIYSILYAVKNFHTATKIYKSSAGLKFRIVTPIPDNFNLFPRISLHSYPRPPGTSPDTPYTKPIILKFADYKKT